MAIKQRGQRSWQAAFSHSGSRYRKDFRSREEAEQWEKDTLDSLRKGQAVKADAEVAAAVTLSELLKAVDERHWTGKRSRDTLYKNGLDCVDILGPNRHPKEVDETRLDFLVAELRKKGLSGATINRKLSAISKMLTHAQRRKMIASKPRIEKERETEHRIRWLSEAEEKALLGWLTLREAQGYHDLFLLMIDAGLRLSEAIRLKWDDVQEGQTRVWGDKSKNGKSRSVPQTSRVKAMLARRSKARPASDERVFHDTLYWGAEHIWRQAKEKMKLDKDPQFVIHCLRHTFCSRLVQRGVQLSAVQKLAGHKTISTTLRYAHLDDASLKSAIAALEGAPPAVHSGQIRLGPMPDTSDTSADTSYAVARSA